MRRWTIGALMAAGLALSGCADTSKSKATKAEPAEAIEIEGSQLKKVVLTERAAERLGIEMKAVTEDAGRRVVPYAAVVYDADGATWVYTSPTRLTFVRAPITITNITGDQAFVSAGPESGTEVVTVGTAELFGVENEIGH